MPDDTKPPETPLGPIPVVKTQKQKFKRRDGSVVPQTVRVINPRTDSRHAK